MPVVYRLLFYLPKLLVEIASAITGDKVDTAYHLSIVGTIQELIAGCFHAKEPMLFNPESTAADTIN